MGQLCCGRAEPERLNFGVCESPPTSPFESPLDERQVSRLTRSLSASKTFPSGSAWDDDLESCAPTVFEEEWSGVELQPPPSCASSLRSGAPCRHVTRWWLRRDELDAVLEGECLFTLLALTAGVGEEWKVCRTLLGMSYFEDEVTDNGMVPLPLDEPELLKGYLIILSRAVYVLPGVTLQSLPLEMYSSIPYHKDCQPGNPRVWEDCTEPNTFRITKRLFIGYSMCVQFRCSEIALEYLPDLNVLTGGLRVHRAILMERTKRTRGKQDNTKACKSILLYHQLRDGGVVCVNTTAVISFSVPGASMLVNRFGSMGTAEVSETALRTRAYLSKHR
eukprot:Hpha_TRINITY_DN29855_c0_g1::TRINITY_DN29855_c0_g1_i1::g.2945::m.2945